MKAIILIALLASAFATETYFESCPQFDVTDPTTVLLCTDALDWLVYLTPMEELSESFKFAATMTISSNLQDYCDFLYGFSALCDQGKTVDTITQDDITNSNLLSGLNIQWTPIQTELANFWETYDWSPCEDYYVADPTSLATCKAFWDDNIMPANYRQFGMTQCFTQCDIDSQAKKPDLFYKDCIFPSWYEYSNKFKINEENFEVIFQSCLYRFDDPTQIPIGYDQNYFVKNLKDVDFTALANCMDTTTGFTLIKATWDEIVAHYDTTCQDTFYEYEPSEVKECTQDVLESTGMTMQECKKA